MVLGDGAGSEGPSKRSGSLGGKKITFFLSRGKKDSFLMLFVHGFSARLYVRSVPCVGGVVSLQVVRRAPGREAPLFSIYFSCWNFSGTQS